MIRQAQDEHLTCELNPNTNPITECSLYLFTDGETEAHRLDKRPKKHTEELWKNEHLIPVL